MTRILLIVTLLLLGGALIAGFALVGGPKQARIERDDRDRARHLRDWGHYHACTLEKISAPAQICANARRLTESVDPETGAPYAMTRSGPNEFRVCATFKGQAIQQGAPYERQNIQFEGQEGCLIYRRQAENQAWVLQ